MYCINCGKQLPDNAKFCPECGAKCGNETATVNAAPSENGAKTIRLKCRSCQANMEVDASRQEATCPYCGEKMMIFDSDVVAAEKIKSSAYKEVEFAKIENEKAVREAAENKEEKENYKKGKLAKWSIIFVFICLLMMIHSFSEKQILAGIIALVQTGLFAASWLMGMKIIKEPRKSVSTAIAILGFILIIPFAMCSSGSNEKEVSSTETSPSSSYTTPPMATTEAEMTEEKKTIEETTATVTVAENTYKDTLNKSECFTIITENIKYYIPNKFEITENSDDGITLEAQSGSSYEQIQLVPILISDTKSKEEVEQYLSSDEQYMSFIANLIDDMGAEEDASDKLVSDLCVAGSAMGKIAETKLLIDSVPIDLKVALLIKDDVAHIVSSIAFNSDEALTSILGSAEYVKDHVGVTITEEKNTSTREETSSKNDSAVKETEAASASGIRSEFKEAMDSYEDFFDEYVAFMKKYSNSSNTLSLMNDYLEYMQQYAETMEKLEAIEEDDLSDEETKYYLEVMTRINKKLLEVSM